jgi:hypothetical protein
MPFPYYNNLSPAKKRIYRKSDAIARIPVRSPEAIHPVTVKLKESLEANKRSDVARYASEICRLVCEGLGTEPLVVKIKARRPSSSQEELQGLYEREDGAAAVLTVWMKTSAKGQVVAFKSFIRTVLHELCHHIDYEHFDLDDSLHTEGFFKREASLYKQIVPEELQRREPRKKKAPQKQNAPRKRKVPREKIARQKSKEPEQMELF